MSGMLFAAAAIAALHAMFYFGAEPSAEERLRRELRRYRKLGKEKTDEALHSD